MAKNGNDIIIYRGSTLLAGVKSNDITTKADTIEVSSPTNGQYSDHIPGRKEWSVNVSYLILADADLLELLNVGTIYTLKICGRNATDANTLTGQATLTTCKITASRGNLVQGSFVFQGKGALAPVST